MESYGFSNRGISHFTCKSILMCSRIHTLHKGAFATSWLFEVPPGARSGMLETSSSCWLDTHVGYQRGRKSCPFLLVPAWLATRGNLHSNTFHTLSMLQLWWRSSIAIRVQCAHMDSNQTVTIISFTFAFHGAESPLVSIEGAYLAGECLSISVHHLQRN